MRIGPTRQKPASPALIARNATQAAFPGLWRGLVLNWPLAHKTPTAQVDPLRRSMSPTNAPGVNMGYTRRGRAVLFETPGGGQRLNISSPASLELPTAATSVLYVARKRDSTFRQSGAFGNFSAETSAVFGAHVPWDDGVVYWDFGNNSSPGRVSVAGLSFNQSKYGDDVWIFTAGAHGSEIWQNGIFRAGHTTGISRSSAAINWGLGSYQVTNNDAVDVSCFRVWNRRLSWGEIALLTSDPFAVDRLRPELAARAFAIVGGSGRIPWHLFTRVG